MAAALVALTLAVSCYSKWLLFQVAAVPSGKVNQGLKLNTPSEPPMA